MKQEIRLHLIPLIVIFLVTVPLWLIDRATWTEYIFLILGLSFGAFFLDIDHLIYWLYLQPQLEESRLAKVIIQKKDYRHFLLLFESTHKKHTSLIFHHYFFQIVLALLSLFVFTSSNITFGKAFLLAVNIHLLVDEIIDYRLNPKHLQDWLFARENQQLPLNYLSYYLTVFLLFCLVFFYLLIISHQ